MPILYRIAGMKVFRVEVRRVFRPKGWEVVFYERDGSFYFGKFCVGVKELGEALSRVRERGK